MIFEGKKYLTQTNTWIYKVGNDETYGKWKDVETDLTVVGVFQLNYICDSM